MWRHSEAHLKAMPPASRQGFSLFEVVIVIAVAISLVFVVGSLNSNVNLLNNLVSVQLQSRSDITQTLQIMTTEVRSAQSAQNGAYAIDSAATSSFAFYTSINKNGTVEHVRYYYASSTIYKGVIEPTGTPATYPSASETITDIIDSVILTSSTTLFQYYDATYVGSSSPALAYPITVSNIRLILLSFGADIKPNLQPGPTLFSTLMDVRNLRSN